MTVIFVVSTIVVFLLVDWVVRRRRARREAPAGAAIPTRAGVRTPAGVFFAPSHTWLSLFPTGRAWLGVDDFVARLLEHPRVQFLKRPGERVARGEPLLALADDGRRLTVRSPVDARVAALNSALADPAAPMAEAPFVAGWAVELVPERPADLKAMRVGDETAGWIQEEFRRLRDVLAGASPSLSPAMLQDGGAPIAGAMKHAADDVWRQFEKEFLEVH